MVYKMLISQSKRHDYYRNSMRRSVLYQPLIAAINQQFRPRVKCHASPSVSLVRCSTFRFAPHLPLSYAVQPAKYFRFIHYWMFVCHVSRLLKMLDRVSSPFFVTCTGTADAYQRIQLHYQRPAPLLHFLSRLMALCLYPVHCYAWMNEGEEDLPHDLIL